MQLSQDKFSVISYDDDQGILTLTWSEATANMTDEDFKTVNLAYAKFAEERKVQRLLVDVRQFGHRFGPDLGTWRAQEIIPRYHRAGVKKMAFVHGSGFDESQPGMAAHGENFITRHLALLTSAHTWLMKA